MGSGTKRPSTPRNFFPRLEATHGCREEGETNNDVARTGAAVGNEAGRARGLI